MTAMLGALLMAASTTVHPSWVDVGTFAVSAAIILSGAIGVVVARNPVHAALMLVMTLFGVAVLFVLQRDPFLAAVQVIVYAGAIVVLFLFVIMFLGVDREENIAIEPLRGQRPMAAGLILLGTTGLLLLGEVSSWTTGAQHVAGVDSGAQSNVYLLGKSVYTTYLFPFEATAALLIIAVVGAVVLARRPPGSAVRPAEDEPVLTSGGVERSAGGAELSTGGADRSAGGAELSAGGADRSTGGADLPTGGADRSTRGADLPTGGADRSTGGADLPTGGAGLSTGGADLPTGGADRSTGGADLPTGGAGLSTGGADLPTGGAGLSTGGADLPTGGAGLSASAPATSATDEPGPGQDGHSAAAPAGALEEGRA